MDEEYLRHFHRQCIYNKILFMSLTFYDEHLAWQQRIQKEVVRAAMVQ